jgi:hypothetical protein
MAFNTPNTGFIDSVTPLGISGVYVGATRDMRFDKSATITVGKSFETPYSVLNLICRADQSSATNGVAIQGSYDGTTFYTVETDTLTVGTFAHSHIQTPVSYPFMRVQYTNGGVAQGEFKMTSSVQ